MSEYNKCRKQLEWSEDWKSAIQINLISLLSPKERQATQQLAEDVGLVDLRRLINPKEREFIFFSQKH